MFFDIAAAGVFLYCTLAVHEYLNAPYEKRRKNQLIPYAAVGLLMLVANINWS